MNKTIALFCLLLSISCGADKDSSINSNEDVKNDVLEIIEGQKLVDELFDIDFQIEKLENNQYNLVVTIELNSGSYIISPYSEDSTYGQFNISIADSGALILGDTLLETPNSIEEYDSVLERTVKIVRQTTTYKQKISVDEQDDFEIPGLIWFVLEPICIPYEVGFVISYSSGEMQIKKTRTIGCLKNCCRSKYTIWPYNIN